MNLQTKYVSLDEFQEYFGIDLREELAGETNALAFMKRLEDRMEAFINSNFNRSIDREYPVFSENQKEKYKLALLEQALYIFRNGDISVDSGADLERGVIMPRGTLKQLTIAPNAEANLRLCGLWNRNLRSNRTGFWWYQR